MSTSTANPRATEQDSGSSRRSPGKLLFGLGVLVVLAGYVYALIGLDSPSTRTATRSLDATGVGYGVVAMFATLCAFVLAFIAAAKSDRF